MPTLREGLAKELHGHDEDHRRAAHQHHPPRGQDHRARPRRGRGHRHARRADAELRRLPRDRDSRSSARRSSRRRRERTNEKEKQQSHVGAHQAHGASYMQARALGIIALALVLAALSAVMTIIGPDKIGKMATIMSDGLFTGIDLAAIAKIGVFLAIIYCLSALFGFIQHYIMAVVTLKMSYRMRARALGKDQPRAAEVFQHHLAGRHFEPHHKRCVNAPAGTYQQPADHHQRRDAVCRLPDHDVRDRMAHGARRRCASRSLAWCSIVAHHVEARSATSPRGRRASASSTAMSRRCIPATRSCASSRAVDKVTRPLRRA